MGTTAEQIIKAYPRSRAFADKLVSVSEEMGIDPAWLANVIQSESSFNTKAVNPNNGAAGLIQFTKTTARGMGTSTSAILNMSGSQQLDLVKRYLQPYLPLRSQLDVVLAVFYPAALGKPNNFDIADHYAAEVMGRTRGSDAYWRSYNYLKDINNGIHLKGDYTKKFQSRWRLVPPPGPIQILGNVALFSISALASAGVIFYINQRRDRLGVI